MGIERKTITASGVKFTQTVDGEEIARASLYILNNDLHTRPFGFIEDVYVDDSVRGQGHGSQLVKEIISYARLQNCYKLICTSRSQKPKVHELYERLGFKKHGFEFRINFG